MKLSPIILSLCALSAAAQPLAFGWNLNDKANPPVKAHTHSVHTQVSPRPWHNAIFLLEYEENRLQSVHGAARIEGADPKGDKALQLAGKAAEGFTARFGPPLLVEMKLDDPENFWECMSNESCGKYTLAWQGGGFLAVVSIRGQHKGVGVVIKKQE